MHKLLHNLLENTASSLFILYQSFSFGVLLLSVLLGLYDEISGFPKDLHPVIFKLELFVSAIILFEYLGRLYLSKNKLAYVVHPLSIIDLVALIPFFQPFRLLRFVVLSARLFRITYRYRYVLIAYRDIFKSVSFELLLLLSSFPLVFLIILIVFYSIEKSARNPEIKSIFDAFYVLFITMTTVGYGDITPITWEGKVLAMITAVAGIFAFSSLVATMSAGLSNYVNMLRSGMLSYRDMKDHIVICGWNETGNVIVEKLKDYGRDIVVITTQDLSGYRGFHYKKGDFGSEEVMKDAGIDKAHMVIVLAEKLPGYSEDSVDARTILAGMQARDLNRNAVIVLEILLRENAKLIKRRNVADYIVIGGEVVGSLIASLVHGRVLANLIDYIEAHLEVEVISAEAGKRIGEIERELEDKGYRILGVMKENRISYFPKLSHKLSEEEKLIVLREKSK